MVDSNVLLDLISEDAEWFAWSADAIEEAADRHRLVINPIIYGEVSIRFAGDFLRNEPSGLIYLLLCLRSPEQRDIEKRGDTSLPSWVPDLRILYTPLSTRRDLHVKVEIAPDVAIITFEVYDFGVVEISAAAGDPGCERLGQPAVKGVDEVGQISLRLFPQACYDMGYPQEGDRVCMLIHPVKFDIGPMYNLMRGMGAGVENETIILREQNQTYHGGAVYRLVSSFEWRIYQPSEQLAKVTISVG